MWLSDVDAGKGYAVDFLSVSLHAVSRDPEAYPSPCIYTQVCVPSFLVFYGRWYFWSPIDLSWKFLVINVADYGLRCYTLNEL